MDGTLHIIGGDIAGGSLAKSNISGISGDVFTSVAAAETALHCWGDITLWAKINALATRKPPLVKIEGSAQKLSEWPSAIPLNSLKLKIIPNKN